MKKTSHKILHVSDLHLGLEVQKRFSETMKDREFDSVFITGDFLNIGEAEARDESLHPKHMEQIREQVQLVSSSLKVDPKRIFYLPGNHDPIACFDDPEQANIHGKAFQLEEGLAVGGLGGSVPFYFQHRKEIAFPGFPYASEAEVEPIFEKVWGQLKEKFPEHQIIMATHIAPLVSPTERHFEGGRFYSSGSPTFDRAFEEEIPPVLWMHGHSHSGLGFASRKVNRQAVPGCE